jgi:hypothetical protein
VLTLARVHCPPCEGNPLIYGSDNPLYPNYNRPDKGRKENASMDALQMSVLLP